MSKLKFDFKTSEARLPIFITNTIRLQPQPTSSSRGGRLTMENRHRLFSGLGGFWFLGFVSCKLKSGASNKLGNTDVFLSNRSDKVFLARDYRMLGQCTGAKTQWFVCIFQVLRLSETHSPAGRRCDQSRSHSWTPSCNRTPASARVRRLEARSYPELGAVTQPTAGSEVRPRWRSCDLGSGGNN